MLPCQATGCGCRLPIFEAKNWTGPDLQTLAMKNHVLRLFCLFNSIASGPLYPFIVMVLFIVFLVPIYYSFCVCFISYIFICYSFHYKYFCNYPTKKKKKKNSIPRTCALRISSPLSIACSQASLRLAFSIAYLICGLAPCC